MIYGYTRISRKEQSIDRQIRNIKSEYPTSIILKEAYTGTKVNRPGWTKLRLLKMFFLKACFIWYTAFAKVIFKSGNY